MNDANPRGPLVRTEGLCKTYPDGQVEAVVDVNLRIDRGEYVAVMGPSGSGKSTLLNLLGALDRPTRGEVYFEGVPLSRVANLDLFRSQKIGFVFQSFYLLPTLTALENVQVPMFEGPLPARARARKAAELLRVFGLSDRSSHLPSQLSYGQRQRVALARSLANDPVLLLADEPTGNLDSGNGEEVLDLFDKLRRDRGTTLIVITHSTEVARRARRIAHVRDGRVVEDAPVGDAVPSAAADPVT
jgi:putative ABC transport system ATP-binding protein